MIHNHERLLVKLVEQYYGLVPSLTAQVLLHHESILMKRTDTYSKLSKSDFKKGLDLLIRCNLAKVIQIKRYKKIDINSERIVNLLYYPYYLVIVNKKFGVLSVSLLKTLILYGNQSVEDLIERTLFLAIVNVNPLDIVRNEEQMKTYIKNLFSKYMELSAKRIIIPLNKSNSCSDQCNIELICSSLKKRFEGDPLKSELIRTDSKSFVTFDCDVLNFLLFIELFPYFSNQPFANEEASFVFKLLLELTYEKSFSMKKTPLPLTEIFSKYNSHYPTVNISQLATILNVFSHFFAPNFIQIEKTCCSLNFDIFVLDIGKIIVKEFVKKNYGENAVRIFGALLERPCVFENDLLNSLKMDSKELHKNLYQLDLNRMINIDFYSEPNQSSTFSARNIKKTFSVNLNEVITCILKRCYYSLYSIMHRRNIEMNDQKDLISRKNHIETYKKEISEHIEDQEEKGELIKTAHNYMSEIDHKKAESLLAYDTKVDKIDYNLINYIFILNIWKVIDSSSERESL